MSLRVLIAPDKFKGTLTAQAAAAAIARGWHSARPTDRLDVLPLSDGGDGFGEVLSGLLRARPRPVKTVDAAHRPIRAAWWWQPNSRTAIIESARVNGLAMFRPGEYHPFQLDTYGLGRVLRNVEKAGAKHCLIGVGGSATNDGGFGLARSLGWNFSDRAGNAITEWWQLHNLTNIQKPAPPLKLNATVAVDVKNPLLGARGCSRIYGPQKGLRAEDFPLAEKCLRRLSHVLKSEFGIDCASPPGAGAAGGLGFGLMAFIGARVESGFEIVASLAKLEQRIGQADIVITGEGAIDRQTYMGKGVGQVGQICRKKRVPCFGVAGVIFEPEKAKRFFAQVRALTEITSADKAKKQAAHHLEKLAKEVAKQIPGMIRFQRL